MPPPESAAPLRCADGTPLRPCANLVLGAGSTPARVESAAGAQSGVHGYAASGPYRTACGLTGSEQPENAPVSPVVRQQLLASTTIAREHGPVEAYRHLNNPPGRITGLGPAFLTKWLFVATAKGDPKSPAAAPVLDALVLQWLREHTDARRRAGRTSDYERTSHSYAQGRTPGTRRAAEVEVRIFAAFANMARTRPGLGPGCCRTGSRASVSDRASGGTCPWLF